MAHRNALTDTATAGASCSLACWYPPQYGHLLAPPEPASHSADTPSPAPFTPRGKASASPLRPSSGFRHRRSFSYRAQSTPVSAGARRGTANAYVTSPTKPSTPRLDVPGAAVDDSPHAAPGTAADADTPRSQANGRAHSAAGSVKSQAASNLVQGKWWEDSDEPLYCVVAPTAITIARPCSADDQVRNPFPDDVQHAHSLARPPLQNCALFPSSCQQLVCSLAKQVDIRATPPSNTDCSPAACCSTFTACAQVQWLLEHGGVKQAMDAALAAAYVRPATWRAAASRYLAHLIDAGDFEGAL
jgi:hypothetical protein